MRPFSGLSLDLWTAEQAIADPDVLDGQHLVLDEDLTFGLRRQLAVARIDPARFQRASQCPCESTRRRRDHVVEGRGVIRVLTRGGAVVLSDLVVSPEDHGLWLRRQVRLPDRPSVPDDSYPRGIGRLLFHPTTMAGGPAQDAQLTDVLTLVRGRGFGAEQRR